VMGQSNAKGDFEYVPSRLVISPAQDRQLVEVLDKVAKQAPAKLVLLADRNGQTIYNSEKSNDSWLVELAALIAGDLAASEEMARLMNSTEEHQLILREGVSQHAYIAKTGPHLVLFVQTSSEVPLGWSRLIVQEAVQELGDIFAGASVEDDEDKNFSPEGFDDSVNNALDGLFS
jgi:predicted regulator of Ras-like GTPase activity (Roadblock/LC7/MglB family)